MKIHRQEPEQVDATFFCFKPQDFALVLFNHLSLPDTSTPGPTAHAAGSQGVKLAMIM